MGFDPTDDPPIHFFTIVLNGEPFIRHHLEVFQQLPFRWHWHIIEGVAALAHDTAWSLANGGRIDPACHAGGLSNDGTREYLDALLRDRPGQVTVYRKPGGAFWNGKLEMANAPLANIQEPCLLWQVDVDEYWTPEQIIACRRLFQEDPEPRAAFFRCHFYVGAELVVSSRETYGNNSSVDWLRVWRFQPGNRWTSHEPPMLVGRWQLLHAGFRRLLGKRPKVRLKNLKAFSHAVTEAHGLVFTHLAYVLPIQVAFKEQYYGYRGARQQWETLQAQERFPVALKDYFPWVKDGATVNRASDQGLPPWVNP
jgi:hypothetical protein